MNACRYDSASEAARTCRPDDAALALGVVDGSSVGMVVDGEGFGLVQKGMFRRVEATWRILIAWLVLG